MLENFIRLTPEIPYILKGIFVTLKYAGLSMFFGLIWGCVLSILKISNHRLLSWFSRAYTAIFRGTPLIVQLALIYYATPQVIGYKISAFEAGVLAFSLNSGAYVSEIIRSGILSLDKGQFEASYALGLSKTQMMKDIIFPQAIKNILPALVNEMVDLVKESALVSVIAEEDIFRRANLVGAKYFIYFETLMLVAVVYFCLVMMLSKLARYLEIRMNRHVAH
ncbi:MAG: amino acid ABC transporter permease [Candidatus Nucleicultricaceae bacterium]